MADNRVPVEPPPVDPQNLQMLMGVGALLNGKGIHEYSIPEQRDRFRKYQATPVKNTGISVERLSVDTAHGAVNTFLYRPKSVDVDLPFIYFIHGGGWILGSACDWGEFLFDLVQRTQLAVVFPEYTLAPERQYPTQQQQCLEVLQHVLNESDRYGLTADKVAIACDSVGAQLACAVSILNSQRSLGIPVTHQFMLHPFVDTTPNAKIVEMPLTNLAWTAQFYASYFDDTTERTNILASPGLMSVEETKKYMPPTTVVTSEIDGLKGQGEVFARLLQTAGVSCGVVQAVGCLHDFEIFHLARESPTADLIMTLMAAKLRQVLSS